MRLHISVYGGLCMMALAGVCAALGGCGGGGGGNGPAPIQINQPPTVNILQPATQAVTLDVRTAQSLTLKVKADDPDGGQLRCVWTWDAGSVSPAEATVNAGSEYTSTFTPPAHDGLCRLSVSVSDGEDNAVKTLTVSVIGNNVEPGTQLRIVSMTLSPDPVSPSGTAGVSCVVDNPGGKQLTYTWKTKYGRITGTGAAVSWSAPSAPGIYGIYVTVADGTTSVTAGKAATVSGPSGGLRAQYCETYRDREVVKLDGVVMERIDPTINFMWEKLSPDPAKLPGNGWGARWQGYIKCEQPGVYTFRVHVDDGARMRVQDDSGQWVSVIPNTAENWSDHTEGAWLPETPIPLNLQGGKWYPVELEFFEGAGDAFIHLYWSVNGSPEALVPQEVLKPPS